MAEEKKENSLSSVPRQVVPRMKKRTEKVVWPTHEPDDQEHRHRPAVLPDRRRGIWIFDAVAVLAVDTLIDTLVRTGHG